MIIITTKSNNINDDKLEDDPQPLFQTQRKETL